MSKNVQEAEFLDALSKQESKRIFPPPVRLAILTFLCVGGFITIWQVSTGRGGGGDRITYCDDDTYVRSNRFEILRPPIRL